MAAWRFLTTSTLCAVRAALARRCGCRARSLAPRPACTPTAIRAVLAANADSGTLQRYDQDLDAAFEQAREQGDVTPLVQTVKRWWFEADAWRDPKRSGSSWLASTPTG